MTKKKINYVIVIEDLLLQEDRKKVKTSHWKVQTVFFDCIFVRS